MDVAEKGAKLVLHFLISSPRKERIFALNVILLREKFEIKTPLIVITYNKLHCS